MNKEEKIKLFKKVIEIMENAEEGCGIDIFTLIGNASGLCGIFTGFGYNLNDFPEIMKHKPPKLINYRGAGFWFTPSDWKPRIELMRKVLAELGITSNTREEKIKELISEYPETKEALKEFLPEEIDYTVRKYSPDFMYRKEFGLDSFNLDPITTGIWVSPPKGYEVYIADVHYGEKLLKLRKL